MMDLRRRNEDWRKFKGGDRSYGRDRRWKEKGLRCDERMG